MPDRPLRGQARLGFQPVADQPRRRLADEVLPIMGQFQALGVANLDDAKATLTERDWFNGPPRSIPRDRWRFPDHEHVELDGGFVARRHYELTYTTDRCPVTGAGFAATRDVVSHLRGAFTHTLGFGVSQSGRWLRQFVRDTGNADEKGRRVFDGIHCHIAGGRVGEFNNRYGQPSTMNPLGFCHLPPFSPTDGLLDRAREHGTVPKMVFTNTATEYWRGDASLGHPDPDDSDCRWYLYAGTHHTGLMPGYVETLPVQLEGNQIDTIFPTRAHTSVLDEWVRAAPSRPRRAYPAPMTAAALAARSASRSCAPFRGSDGVAMPDAKDAARNAADRPRTGRGRGRRPLPGRGARPGRDLASFRTLDEDGNEVAGVRLPHVSVPLDVSFGWNPERPRDGIPVEAWNLIGGRVVLPPGEIMRRYGDLATFLARVRADAEALVAARHLLAEDVDMVVADAEHRWVGVFGSSSTSTVVAPPEELTQCSRKVRPCR